MYQLTIRQADTIQHQSCFATISAAEHRADKIRGTFPRGVMLQVEIVELCEACAGRGYALETNKKRSRAGFSEPCKQCNKTGIIGDVMKFEGD